MKTTIISVAIILVAATGVSGAVYYHKKKQSSLISMCPTDVMMCPDGTSVPRSGPNCEFGVCKQIPAPEIEAEVSAVIPASSSVSSIASVTIKNKPVTTNLFKKITTGAASIIKETAAIISSDVSSGIKETSQTVSSNPTTPKNVVPVTPTRPAIDETRYNVEKNKIVDENNKPIYTLPPSTSGSNPVNVVPVGGVPPVIGAVPVDGLPGKYYLSENSHGADDECHFSNRIYILDTVANTKTLMYEENNATLNEEDPRACDSEMYLLATDNEKLVMKYHTLGTNTTCDSTWSEPEKTWYLDVTHIDKGTRRYFISSTLYLKAEEVEAACRLHYESTSTKPTPIDDR